MKLEKYFTLKNSFTQNEIAKQINGYQPDVSAWIHNKKKIPLHFALAIEKVTNGMVSVNELPLSNSAKKTLEQINNNV